MSFSPPNQFAMFAMFLSLGAKYGLEQKTFSLVKNMLTNKIIKVLSVMLNVVVVIINCAQFYFLAIKQNFGDIRFFMFFSFFLGFSLVFALCGLLFRIKNYKKVKKKTN